MRVCVSVFVAVSHLISLSVYRSLCSSFSSFYVGRLLSLHPSAALDKTRTAPVFAHRRCDPPVISHALPFLPLYACVPLPASTPIALVVMPGWYVHPC